MTSRAPSQSGPALAPAGRPLAVGARCGPAALAARARGAGARGIGALPTPQSRGQPGLGARYLSPPGFACATPQPGSSPRICAETRGWHGAGALAASASVSLLPPPRGRSLAQMAPHWCAGTRLALQGEEEALLAALFPIQISKGEKKHPKR